MNELLKRIQRIVSDTQMIARIQQTQATPPEDAVITEVLAALDGVEAAVQAGLRTLYAEIPLPKPKSVNQDTPTKLEILLETIQQVPMYDCGAWGPVCAYKAGSWLALGRSSTGQRVLIPTDAQNPVFTSEGDLVAWLKENHPNFDRVGLAGAITILPWGTHKDGPRTYGIFTMERSES